MRELFYPFSILPPLSQSSKVKLELKDNGGDTWSSTIRGRAVKGNKLFEYKLQILGIPNGGASNQSPFDYSLHPVSLTVKRSADSYKSV